MSCYVYLIQSKESHRLKIGIADNPSRRLAGLQTGSPELLVMVAAIKMPGDRAVSRRSAERMEKALHSRFGLFRLHGEWFRHHPAILEQFKRMEARG